MKMESCQRETGTPGLPGFVKRLKTRSRVLRVYPTTEVTDIAR